MTQPRLVLGLALLLVVALSPPGRTQTAAGEKTVRGLDVDDRTIFALQVDEKKGELVDRTDRFKPVVSGGKVVEDDYLGQCLRFGDGDKNGVSVSDGGKIAFEGGFTLEVWLYLEEQGRPNPGGTLAGKIRSFWFTIKDYKLDNAWMVFPTEEVFTTNDKQIKHFPVDSESFYGAMSIPADRWVHLAVTYDQEMKVIRTWVDGGLDRTRYMVREGDAPLQSDPTRGIDFVRGMKNVRLGGLRLSRGARPIGPAPIMEAQVHQLPHEDKVAVCINHIA
ncbi:MAG: LamG domain-containing protein, partial [Planctomycetes bacterium]|nr:LamG domain-containing protein [Planctomycetota bacterium]